MTDALAPEYAASELAGELYVQSHLRDYTQADLENLVISTAETVRDGLFLVGDAVTCYVSRAGDKPTDRARALQELEAATGVGRTFLWRAYRVARAFPPELRTRYQDRPQSWFETLTDRTALPGDTPTQRQQRRLEYAEKCADLSVRETMKTLKEELAPVPTDEVPAPPVHETQEPPVQVRAEILPRATSRETAAGFRKLILDGLTTTVWTTQPATGADWTAYQRIGSAYGREVARRLDEALQYYRVEEK